MTKKINIEVTEKLSTEELEELIASLKSLNKFDFFVDVQFGINDNMRYE